MRVTCSQRERAKRPPRVVGCTIWLLASLAAPARGAAPSALEPAGVQASQISDLWWVYFWICAAVYLLVLFFLLAPLRRARAKASPQAESPMIVPEEPQQKRLRVSVIGAVAVTAAVLVYLAIADFLTQRALARLAAEQNPVTISLTGHQWWWEVMYRDPIPSNTVVTANEIHIPVGRAVKIELKSADVIHSFWVPNLHGKKDLVTGHPTAIWIRADQEGVYEGQCAEFCGMQHARMRLVVVAEPEEKFEAWLQAQRQPAATPATESQQQGYAVFMSQTCVNCHSISGTPASGMVGPDLTHLASRAKIAGNSYPNTRGHLGGWVVDPQHLKPGVRMPPNNLKADELHALLDYLESLK